MTTTMANDIFSHSILRTDGNTSWTSGSVAELASLLKLLQDMKHDKFCNKNQTSKGCSAQQPNYPYGQESLSTSQCSKPQLSLTTARISLHAVFRNIGQSHRVTMS